MLLLKVLQPVFICFSESDLDSRLPLPATVSFKFKSLAGVAIRFPARHRITPLWDTVWWKKLTIWELSIFFPGRNAWLNQQLPRVDCSERRQPQKLYRARVSMALTAGLFGGTRLRNQQHLNWCKMELFSSDNFSKWILDMYQNALRWPVQSLLEFTAGSYIP